MATKDCVFCVRPMETPTDPTRAQAAFPARLAAAVRRVSPAQAAFRPAPGKWSIKEIVRHLADVELAYGFRYRMMLAQETPPLQPFDQDLWATNLVYQRADLPSALATFGAVRAENVALARRVGRGAWSRQGQHPQYGTVSVQQMLDHLVHHDANHLGQILRIKGLLEEEARRPSKRSGPVARPRRRAPSRSRPRSRAAGRK